MIFTRTTAFNKNTDPYVQLSTVIDGEADVKVRFAVDAYVVSDPSVTTAALAASNESTLGYFAAQTIVHELRCNPCKTWVRAFGAAGGNAFVHMAI